VVARIPIKTVLDRRAVPSSKAPSNMVFSALMDECYHRRGRGRLDRIRIRVKDTAVATTSTRATAEAIPITLTLTRVR